MDQAFIANLLLVLVAMTTLHQVSPHGTSNHITPAQGGLDNPCHSVDVNTTVITPQGKVLCIVPTEEELMEQLKGVGGYNKHYVAKTQQEADEFENILPWDGAATTETLHKHHGHPNFQHHKHPNFGSRKRKPKSKGLVLNEENEAGLKDQALNEVDEKRHISINGATTLLRSKRSPHPLGIKSSTKVGCISRGQPVGRQQLKQMCAVCQRSSELETDRFPRFINELTCETSNGLPTNGINQCTYGKYPIGTCVQGVMLIDLLKKSDKYTIVSPPSGDYFIAYKQIWIPYTQEIRSCCHCRY